MADASSIISGKPPADVIGARSSTHDRWTETEQSLAAMTPSSRSLFDEFPNALDARIGRSTLAGALNDQIRFRVVGTGPLAGRSLVPDSPLAHRVLASKSGPKLIRQLTAALATTGSTLHPSDNLRGIILAKDTESVRAGKIIGGLDQVEDQTVAARLLPAHGDRAELGFRIRDLTSGVPEFIKSAGAWYDKGWITYMPDTSRGMLTAVGAYHPAKAEVSVRRAKHAEYLARAVPHEAQHAVTPVDHYSFNAKSAWLEEATADLFSQTPVFRSAFRRASGIDPKTYAGHLAHEPSIDLDWKAWERPRYSASEQSKFDEQAKRNYRDGRATLYDLVRLAGVDFRTQAGRSLAYELVQGAPSGQLPGRLAQAIIAQHQLDDSVREELTQRIIDSVDSKTGVRDIARDLGIE